MSDNPYSAPEHASAGGQPETEEKNYGGIGRLAYFSISVGLQVGITILAGILGAALGPESGAGLASIISIGAMLVTFYFASQRLKNTGYNPWTALLMLIPIVNILIGLRALPVSAGYADHKTLNTPAKIITGIFVVLFILVLLAVLLPALGA